MSAAPIVALSEVPRRQVVVFDLDGTLVAGDSFGAFLRHLITRNLLRCAMAVVTVPVWLPAWLLPPTRLAAERYLVWLAAPGMDEDAFAAAAGDFATRHAGPATGRAPAAALERVREHREAGDWVVVATGCASPLAQEVCTVIGLDGVDVVASTLIRRRWGLPQAMPARGEAKLRALGAAGVALPVDHAYSDSFSDLPLLRAARTAHLVDPSPRDQARLQRALGKDIEVLRWAAFRGREARDRTRGSNQ